VSYVDVLYSGTVLEALCEVRQAWMRWLRARCRIELCSCFSSHKACATTGRPILLLSVVYIWNIVQIFIWFIFETLARFSCDLYLKHCPVFHMVYVWNIVQICVCFIFETLPRIRMVYILNVVQIFVWFIRYLRYCLYFHVIYIWSIAQKSYGLYLEHFQIFIWFIRYLKHCS
jgi:hypothetical protein